MTFEAGTVCLRSRSDNHFMQYSVQALEPEAATFSYVICLDIAA
jgi:hypothetical protein